MKYMTLPQFNVALDAMGLIVVTIIFASCLSEQIHEKNGSRSFLSLLSLTILTLVADVLAWVGEGVPSLATMTPCRAWASATSS